MKTIDQMTDEEIIAEIRENAQREGSPEHLIYSLLSTAHPNVIAMIEQQAVKMKKIGSQIAKEINAAEDDPNLKAQILSTLDRASHGFPSPKDDDNIPDM